MIDRKVQLGEKKVPRLIIGAFVLILMGLEEFFFQSFLRRGSLRHSFLSEESDTSDEGRSRRFLEHLRTAQLTGLAVLLFLLDAPEFRLVTHFTGQMVMTVTMLQLVRMLGRNVLRNWSVLGEIQVFQAAMLVAAILVSPKTAGTHTGHGWFGVFSLGLVLFRTLNATALAFSVTYAARLFAREGGRIYHANPPLAFSDQWARRVTAVCLPPALLSAAVVNIRNVGGLPFSILLHSSVLFTISAWVVFRNRRPHHPAAHLLTALTALTILIATSMVFSVG
jgi:hypothetical protein